MPSEHAILAPSAAKRWLTCTPSARLESLEPEQESSYAREGTLAHTVAEFLLKDVYLKRHPAAVYEDIWAEIGNMPFNARIEGFGYEARELNADIEELIRTVHDKYVALVWEAFLKARQEDEDAILLVERKYKLDPIVPAGFGSSDAIIIASSVCSVWDLKYGKGVMVSAEGNSQMRLYGVGALKGPCELYDIKNVWMTIVQPRLDHVSTEALTAEELLDWAYNYVKPRAEIAFKGEGDFVSGGHCQFCRIAHKCPALKAKTEGMVQRFGQQDTLTDGEIAEALGMVDEVKIFIKALEDHATAKLLNGENVPGYKLVEGRSLSRIEDHEAVIAGLEKAGIDLSLCIKPRELKGLTDLKRILRTAGYNEFVAPYVVKPQGKPTIVKDSDPRPVFEARRSAAEDFGG